MNDSSWISIGMVKEWSIKNWVIPGRQVYICDSNEE